MAATTTKTKDARSGKGGGGKGAAAARAKDEERAAKQKAKEKEAARKAKDKEREAKRKEKEREARRKEKEREARAKEKQRSEREKEKQREQKAKERRDKEKAARAKEKEREQKAKDKQREARRKEKEREARFADKHPARHRAHADGSAPADTDTAGTDTADTAPAGTAPDDTAPDDNAPDDTDGPPAAADVQVGQQEVQPAEDVAVPERGETTDVAEHPGLAPLPELDVPDNDTAVHPKGYLAAALGKEDAVTRSTQRATVAASYTTRDHDLIRAWAQTRGGRPADVVGTGNGGAGVLRIEFPDGPGDDSRLEDVDWGPFFRTFDESDVDFLYQERVRTGDVSRFHKIVRADA